MRRVLFALGLLSFAAGCPSGLAPPPFCGATDMSHCRAVDDAGVTHGCGPGGGGPGDRDDGGGLPPSAVPDLGVDVRNQGFGQPCLFNEQCASNLCFYFRVKGQVCTETCSCPSDCPAGTLGCGGMGVCRVGN